MEHTLFVLLISVALAAPMVAAIETGFVITQSDGTRRVLYAIAAVWYAIFLYLFWHASPAAGWVYAIPQVLVACVYAVTKFRAAPSHRR